MLTMRKHLVPLFVLVVVAASLGKAEARGDGDASQSHLSELAGSELVAQFGLKLGEAPTVDGRLEDYLVLALRENEQLKSRYAEYLAAREGVAEATSLPDPKVGYTEYLQPVETRVGPQERGFNVTQSFPWFGTLSQHGEVRRERAEAIHARFIGAAFDLIAQVKQAYYDIGYLERAIDITTQHIGLLAQWENVAQVRYSAGSGKYTDVVKAQVELGILANRQAELEDQRRPVAAALNALLNRDAASPAPYAGAARVVTGDWQLGNLASRMNADNPLLTAWDHLALESLGTDRLVRMQSYPSFSVGLNYISTGEARMSGVPDTGKNALMASVAISLPIWRGKYDAASRAAVARYQGAVSAKRDLANSLSVSLERAHYRYRDAQRKVDLYRTALLPKGRQSMGATRLAYEAGTSSFLDLVDSQRLMLEFELSQARAEFDVLIQEANLEKLVAGPITADPASRK